MSTQLHDLMHDAVRETHPDLATLVDRSRRRGLGIRRRRQAMAMLGSAVAVVAVAAGSWQLAARTPDRVAASSPPPNPPSASPAPAHRVQMTGRAVAAGLAEAVHDAVGLRFGGATDFKGQSSTEAYAELHLQPSDHSGYSLVGVNVQPDFADKEIYRCRDWQVDCRVLHPSRGVTLMTYEEHAQAPEGLGIRVVADLLRADGVRVVSSSSNGEQLAGNRWRVTRARPPMTATQLYLVDSEPWWGPTMDERFVKAGERLPSYTDLDSEIS